MKDIILYRMWRDYYHLVVRSDLPNSGTSGLLVLTPGLSLEELWLWCLNYDCDFFYQTYSEEKTKQRISTRVRIVNM